MHLGQYVYGTMHLTLSKHGKLHYDQGCIKVNEPIESNKTSLRRRKTLSNNIWHPSTSPNLTCYLLYAATQCAKKR